jgi:hypothetical protein
MLSFALLCVLCADFAGSPTLGATSIVDSVLISLERSLSQLSDPVTCASQLSCARELCRHLVLLPVVQQMAIECADNESLLESADALADDIELRAFEVEAQQRILPSQVDIVIQQWAEAHRQQHLEHQIPPAITSASDNNVLLPHTSVAVTAFPSTLDALASLRTMCASLLLSRRAAAESDDEFRRWDSLYRPLLTEPHFLLDADKPQPQQPATCIHAIRKWYGSHKHAFVQICTRVKSLPPV